MLVPVFPYPARNIRITFPVLTHMAPKIALVGMLLAISCLAGDPFASAQTPSPEPAASTDLSHRLFLPTAANDRQVTLDALGGRISAIAFEDHFAFLGAGAYVIIVDVANPAALREVAWSPILPGPVLDVAVHHGYVYARISSPLQVAIVDAREVESPRVVGYFDPRDDIRDLAFGPDHAYVCDSAGVRVMDARDPLLATRLGELLYDGGARDCGRLENASIVARTDDFVEFPRGTPGWNPTIVRVIDAAIPGAPREIYPSVRCVTTDRNFCEAYFVAGNSVYARTRATGVSSSRASISAYDLFYPRAPQGGWIHYSNATISAATADGGWVFADVASSVGLWHQIDVIDLSKPGEGSIIGQVPVIESASAMRVHGKTLYVIGHGLQAFDITDPSTPRRVGGYALRDKATRVEAQSGWLYTVSAGGIVWLAAGDGGLVGFDTRLDR